MYKYLEIKDMQIYISLLLLTLNVPLRIGKCTPRGTCTPGWETLIYRKFASSWLQWRLRHSGSSRLIRVFEYDLHGTTLACLLCMFVPPPTSLIKVVNEEFFHLALSLLIYFRSTSDLSRSCCRWPESKNTVRSRGSLDFVRWRFTRAHPPEPELPSAIRYFLKYTSYQIEFFFEAMRKIMNLISNLWTFLIRE